MFSNYILHLITCSSYSRVHRVEKLVTVDGNKRMMKENETASRKYTETTGTAG